MSDDAKYRVCLRGRERANDRCPRSLRNRSVNSFGWMNIHAAVDTRKKRREKKITSVTSRWYGAFPQELYIYAVHCPRSEMCTVQRSNACMRARTASPSHCFPLLFCFVSFSSSTEHARLWRRRSLTIGGHVLYTNQCHNRYKEKIIRQVTPISV